MLRLLKPIVFGAGLCALLMGTTPSAKALGVLLGLDLQPWNIDNAAILTLSPTVPAGNHVNNIPCIICANNQPQQPAGFGYNQFGNNGNGFPTVSFFSTAIVPPGPGSGLLIDQFAGATGYNIDPLSPFFQALVGNLGFQIGIDVNDDGKAQTLESFWFLNLTTHTVLGVFSPDPTEGTLVPNIHNGTGFPDWTISGLTLQGINPNDQIMFFARITGANDGPDSFFLISAAAAETPLPAAVWLFGSALGGGAFLLRRRRQKNKAAEVAA